MRRWTNVGSMKNMCVCACMYVCKSYSGREGGQNKRYRHPVPSMVDTWRHGSNVASDDCHVGKAREWVEVLGLLIVMNNRQSEWIVFFFSSSKDCQVNDSEAISFWHNRQGCSLKPFADRQKTLGSCLHVAVILGICRWTKESAFSESWPTFYSVQIFLWMILRLWLKTGDIIDYYKRGCFVCKYICIVF
jgi:hypothetical protein